MGIQFNPFKALFSPAPARPAAEAPVGGNAAGTSALMGYASSSLSLTGGSALGAAVALPNLYDAQGLRQGFVGILGEGVSRDLASRPQLDTLNRYVHQLQLPHLQSLGTLLNWAHSRTEQVFILKALVGGESWQNVVQYATEMRGMPESEIIRRSTMRDARDLVQQWQDACGPALLQVAAGEAAPRFAWELNKVADLAKVDPHGANRLIAQQQKAWLEAYGGAAVERGAAGGQGIAINRMLNELLSPITRVSYSTVEVVSDAISGAINAIGAKLQAGYDVPLRISWGQAGQANDSGHFVLAMAMRGTPGASELQIHDPWSGQTTWVSEQQLVNQRAEPLFGGFARLSHYYDPQPF